MRSSALTVALACLCTVTLVTACSDPASTQGTNNGTADVGGLKDGINLGDVIKDGSKGDGPDQVADEDTGATDDVTDTGPIGCKIDSDCAGLTLKTCEAATCDTATGLCMAMPAADGANCTPADVCFQDGACKAGACEGKTPVSCDDGDDCTTDSCDKIAGCQKAAAADGIPCDDKDPKTTGDKCQSGHCVAGSGTCANTKELNCTDAKDDDCDGATDCDDNDCAADSACKVVKIETNCADKIDDDGDGKTDCDDADCLQHAECKPASETNCTDGKDDDGDGAIDCADNDCANNDACKTPLKEGNCTDLVDDDKDGKTDCADNDCAADVACKVVTKETNCADKVDDDKDGATDCADNDCSADLACAVTVETDCANQVDEDKDGKTDCGDSDCAKAANCTAPATEKNCTDKLDDDKDGLVDCNDGDCAADVACKTTCNVCAVNAKGLVATCDPCAAAVCKVDSVCCKSAWDDICVSEVKQICGKQCETLCTDKKDNDGDGATDCSDDDCATELACTPTQTNCTAAAAIACGASNSGSTLDKAATKALDTYSCTDGKASQETGPEYTYDFTAECDGAVTISLQKTSTKSGFLDLFVLDGAKACGGTTCIAHGLMAGTAGKATITAKKGQKYFVVVDGYADFSGDFSLKIACGCAGGKEVDCGNKLDDDADGATDCADSDCTTALACAPTSETDCKNGKDDDKDGKTDCTDGDCAKDLACSPTTETNCTDKVDNDKDGKLDCLDSDCAKDLACAPTTVETNCADKVDNDKDGKVDCADTDCTGTNGCVCKADFTLTTGATDQWNNSGVGSTKVVSDYVCTDGTASNETGPEYTYGYTSDCDGDLTVTVSKTASASGYLDLFVLDGTKPCGGTSCVAHALMGTTTAVKTLAVTKGQKLLLVVDGYQNFSGDYSIKTTCAAKELNCGNKVDDDKDGKTDCLDTDCAADVACKVAPEANCTDKVDNDKDGKTDCLDTDCAANAACKNPTTETSCTDKVDNDKDGKTDCLDTDCAADVACKPATTETICNDGKDDDKDGKTDCADSDCVGKDACVCKGDFALTCGATDSYANNNPGSTKIVNDYTCKDGTASNETGSEYAYDIAATCDGDVTVTLTKKSTSVGFLDLFVLDGAQVCAGSSCLAHGLMGSTTATVKFAGVKGKAYRVVVDGYNGYSGNYDIKVACACKPATETDCKNKVDDDKDGKVDCADSDCAADPACAPVCKDDTVVPMICGTSDNWTSNGAGSTDSVTSYTCTDSAGQTFSDETGAEYSYAFTADCTGTATVKVTKTGDSTKFLDLFILDGSKPCAGSSCVAHGLMFSNAASASFPVTKGQKFHVVVDGYLDFSGDYAVDTTCACK